MIHIHQDLNYFYPKFVIENKEKMYQKNYNDIRKLLAIREMVL